jgi:hypothetical protein
MPFISFAKEHDLIRCLFLEGINSYKEMQFSALALRELLKHTSPPPPVIVKLAFMDYFWLER